MHKIDGDGHVSGTFTEGDPGGGIAATVITDDWLNAVQGEIVNAVEGAGLVLAKPDNAQLLKAIRAINPVKAYARFATDGVGGVSLQLAQNIEIAVGDGINASGNLNWSYTTDFAADPVVLAMVEYKSTGFYIATYQPLGGPTARGQVRIRDNTGADVNLTTTAVKVHVVAFGTLVG